MDDGKMGPKKYASFERTFVLFDSLCKSFAPGTPIEDWEGWADQWLLWAKKKAKELVDEAYNGQKETPQTSQTSRTEDAPKPKAATQEEVDSFRNGHPPTPQEVVTDGQARRFYGIARNSGFTDEGLEKLLKHHGVKSSWHIPKSKYTNFVSLAQNKNLAQQYNDGKDGAF